MTRFLILISCLFLITNNAHAEKSPCTEHKCIAVIDAGSTGSRLHVFSYDMDKTNTPINITEVWAKKTTPGFASIEATPNNIDAYLTILLSGASVQHVPVYFYATAGMRLLSQSKQKAYYQNLKNWFDHQSNWQLVEAKTIKGNDEALYDWLAVNYHLGTLQSKTEHSVGVMDIGGASIQIAFPVQTNQVEPQESQVELDLYGQHISLFVHSFLGLGQTEITHQLLDSPACFPNNYPLPNGQIGQGNAPECAQEITSLINDVHKAKSIVQSPLTNNPVSSWYAIGGISNLAESKPFQFQNNQLTTQELLQQANSLVCQQSWDDLSSQFPNNDYLDGYCLMPSFYHTLMVEGYGFSPNQTVNYVPSAENLDWTLGVVLHH
ncbi:MAG: multidrug DMT transporter permease [Legionella sp.]|nr:multidrug DMT transporter permease [Legionella sp.]